MKLVRYLVHGQVAVGVLAPEGTVHRIDEFATMNSLIGAGLSAAHAVGASALGRPGSAAGEVELLAPVEPPSVRDFVTFEEHVDGVTRSVTSTPGVVEEWYDAPTFYFGNPHTILGPEDPVRFPPRSELRDFELEVAVVVSGQCRSVDLVTAHEHIFGYTLFNDWSARDLQSPEMRVGLGPAKGKDFATTVGPWLVTADELADAHDGEGFLDLACTASINGEVVGRDVLTNMGWTFADMVSYASRDSVVANGDLLASGTVGNGGCLAELWGRRGALSPAPLRDGDVVTISVERLGVLTTTVASGTTTLAPRRARRGAGQARRAGRASTEGSADPAPRVTRPASQAGAHSGGRSTLDREWAHFWHHAGLGVW